VRSPQSKFGRASCICAGGGGRWLRSSTTCTSGPGAGSSRSGGFREGRRSCGGGRRGERKRSGGGFRFLKLSTGLDSAGWGCATNGINLIYDIKCLIGRLDGWMDMHS
jgi:hypothetical protein